MHNWFHTLFISILTCAYTVQILISLFLWLPRFLLLIFPLPPNNFSWSYFQSNICMSNWLIVRVCVVTDQVISPHMVTQTPLALYAYMHVTSSTSLGLESRLRFVFYSSGHGFWQDTAWTPSLFCFHIQLSCNRYIGRNVCKTGPRETELVMTWHDWWLSLYNGVNLHVFTKSFPFRDFHSLLRWNELLQADCTQMISLHKLLSMHKNVATRGNLIWWHFIKKYICTTMIYIE